MAVSDRWHRRPKPGDALCEHKLTPTSRHGVGMRWMVRWRDDEGVQRKRGFNRRAEAERFERSTRTALDTGTYIDPSAGRVTFAAYVEQWQAGLTSDPGTRATIASRLRVHVLPVLGNVELARLAKRPSMLQAWLRGMEADLAPSTIRGVASIVSQVFAAATDDGAISRNPMSATSVRAPRVDKPKIVPWTLAQVEAMAAALPPRHAAMVVLGAGCGLRQGELFSVAVDDVDFLRQVVHVRRQVRLIDGHRVYSLPKGRKERTVPLAEPVALALAEHIRVHGTTSVTLSTDTPTGDPTTTTLLFSNGAGGAVHRGVFNRAWREARRAAGIADTRENGCHALRHTYASAQLAAGVDVRTVAEFLGHTDPGFTLRTYAHLMPDAADRARRAIGAFFASAPEVPQEAQR